MIDPANAPPAGRPTIAVVGASTNRSKFGNKCVRAYARCGYDVYPVHPRAAEIEGHRAYSSLADIPLNHLDRVSVYLPARVCTAVLPELARKPCAQIWFNPGADSDEVLHLARQLGLPVVVGCSILDVGVDPHQLS
jgi:uncharacterized protein